MTDFIEPQNSRSLPHKPGPNYFDTAADKVSNFSETLISENSEKYITNFAEHDNDVKVFTYHETETDDIVSEQSISQQHSFNEDQTVFMVDHDHYITKFSL